MVEGLYIYHGPGVSPITLLHTYYAFRTLVQGNYKIQFITPSAMAAGIWREEAYLLVMPGGADLPYCAHLYPIGNQHIRSFVREDGGAYLGFCAGY